MTIPGEFFNKYLPCRVCGQTPTAPGDLGGHFVVACEDCWDEIGREVGKMIQTIKDKKLLDGIAQAGYPEQDIRKQVEPRRINS